MSRTSTSLLLILLLMSADEEDENIPFRDRLELRYRRLRSGKIRRLSLDLPKASAFVRLFGSGQDEMLLSHFVGLTTAPLKPYTIYLDHFMTITHLMRYEVV